MPTLYDTQNEKKIYASSKNSTIGLKCKKNIEYNIGKEPFLST